MIYLDTSAMAKLIVQEVETAALVEWLGQRPDETAVTSALGRVELMRMAAGDGGEGVVERAGDLLDGVDIVPISDEVVSVAETIAPATLRSLDAIHLASIAQIHTELTAVIAYDQRLLDGCVALGYPTISPSE